MSALLTTPMTSLPARTSAVWPSRNPNSARGAKLAPTPIPARMPSTAPFASKKSSRSGPVVELVHVPLLNVEASAGHGALAEMEAKSAQFGFDEKWLRRLTASKASSLSIIAVHGDSMEPTLHDGDEVMVDLGDGQARLRDGIYVLRMDDMLSVKRIALEPQGKRASVLSDNPAYPSWRGLEKRTLNIVGRVLWFGRAL